MDKYCNEVSVKYFEKCLNHFQNWNNIFIKLENGLGKLKASSPQSKRLEMQIAGLTLDHVNDEAVILNAQIARESRALVEEVYNLGLTIEDLEKMKIKILSFPLHNKSMMDKRILIIFTKLYTSATTLTKLLRECMRVIRISDLESFDNIKEATKIMTKHLDLFEQNLYDFKDFVN
ncbi:hypothetical protein Anas_02252 [Armadillidium nasatum]|uniref:Uncharacterized protein n=1 Tax=Armadillidium nasatum TaxID=96803 RepID=A0A5N5SQI8_9CRUS|nr:hypothetical protein Anas_02252 [Armadillidium nasatum]